MHIVSLSEEKITFNRIFNKKIKKNKKLFDCIEIYVQ